MKLFMPKLLFYYSAIASFLITLSTVLTSNTIGPVVFATLFLPVTAYFVIEFFKQMRSLFSPKATEGSDLGSPPKKGEYIVMAIIFLTLLGVAIRNIMFPANNNPPGEKLYGSGAIPSPSPLIFKTQEVQPKTILTVKISDGSPLINIRQKPTIYSEKMGEAKDGDTFEYTTLSAGWYEIVLADGSTGYIAAKYAKIN